MDSKKRFRVKLPNVTHETIDGETVILNLDTGSYYSIDNSGAMIWGLIDAGASIKQIVDIVSLSCTGNFQEIESGIIALAEKLEQEGLIVPNDEMEASIINMPDTSTGQSVNRQCFEFPNLRKYTDMEDLLLLDPIHDVDDTGWPNKNQDEK
jgi:hypothetical protein